MATSSPAPPMSAAERLIDSGRDIWRDLAGLDPQVAGLNLLFSALVVVAAFLLTLGLRRLFDHWIKRFAASIPAEVRTPETPRAAGLTWLLTRLAILGGALVLVAGIWGVDLFAWLGGGAGGGIFRAIGVIILAVGAVEVAGFVVDRLVDGFAKRSGDGRRAAQIRTLGPLIRGFIQSVLVVVSALTFLSEVGVKVGPLLASAGVVGVAIGFGAQTLVKDFLTGIFLIVEDIVSVGDVVQISGSGGLVEDMTLRTIRLRDFDGTLHIFPYSEAQVIHNLTKSFSYYVFDLQISYESDIDRAVAVMKSTGEDLARDPEFSPKILAPIEVVGVDGLADSGVKLKARIKTEPIEQWNVGREYNRRIKLAFDHEGIQIPYPHLKLIFPQEAPAGLPA